MDLSVFVDFFWTEEATSYFFRCHSRKSAAYPERFVCEVRGVETFIATCVVFNCDRANQRSMCFRRIDTVIHCARIRRHNRLSDIGRYSGRVIYLHCGWPKTGTTTLQAAVMRHRDRLGAAGILYPNAWRENESTAHVGLIRALRSGGKSSDGIDQFKRELTHHGNGDVLLSCEGVSNWVWGQDRYEALSSFLEVVQEVAPVTCIWTLRRFDEMVHSGCVHKLRMGFLSRSPREAMKASRPERMLPSICNLNDVVHGRALYLKYDTAGTHHTEMLRSLGLPQEASETLEFELASSSRFNRSPTRKELLVITHLKEVSAKTGVALNYQALSDAFHDDNFSFSEDGPCELAGPEARRDLHERALKTARDCGFAAYLRFFAHERLDDYPPPTVLDPTDLADEDLRRLTEIAV
jgi:hypothetical protein